MTEQVKGLLTIGIPAFNGGSNLHGLFLSVSNLGLDNDEFEILVVDNCSTDDTELVIKGLAPGYPNLKFIKNPNNVGRIENWNKVIEHATGEFLIIMNVNDRFLKFNIKACLHHLNSQPNVAMVFADIQFADHVYPAWEESGEIELNNYLRKTFLDTEYLEFHSVGLLHQHIFRRKIIADNSIRFDPSLPRTTDRVFTTEVVMAGNGRFYYINQPMVSWHLHQNRYHYNVHVNQTDFNFEELWVNEYKANAKMAALANISFKEFIESQLMFAWFNHYRQTIKIWKQRLGLKTSFEGMEMPTAIIYLTYLKVIVRLQAVPVSHINIKVTALKRLTTWYLRSLGIVRKNRRTLKDNIVPIPQS